MKSSVTFCASLIVLMGQVTPSAADETYKGQNIDVVIAGNVGAGYDTYARTLMRHMGRHIPGVNGLIARNMPGAGGAVASAWLYNLAPKDGRAIGAIYPGAILNPLLYPEKQFNYDPTAFHYIGSADSSVYICVTFHTSPVKTYEDAKASTALIGAESTGSTFEYAHLHRKAGGVKFNVIPGYKGTGDVMLAMERREVDGLCGLDWSSLKAQRPEWIRDNRLNILVQDALEPSAELTARGVPHSLPLMKEPADRRAAELIFAQQVFGRPYIAPPGTPAGRVEALRKGFTMTMKDEAFLADAKKSRLNIDPASGDRVQRLIHDAFNAPKEIVQRARELISP